MQNYDAFYMMLLVHGVQPWVDQPGPIRARRRSGDALGPIERRRRALPPESASDFLSSKVPSSTDLRNVAMWLLMTDETPAVAFVCGVLGFSWEQHSCQNMTTCDV